MKRFSGDERQYLLKEIGRDGQMRLDQSQVAIVGVGILGLIASDMLARAGIGTLRLVDRDFLWERDLQSRGFFDEKDLAMNLPKAIAAAGKLRKINSEIKIQSVVADVNAKSIEGILGGVDLIVDGTDNFETRFLLNDYSLVNKIPWIYGGAVATEGMAYVVLPGEGPCLRCLFGEAPGFVHTQTCDQIGTMAPVAHLVASFQAIEAIKILAGRRDAVERRLWKVDLWGRQFKTISVKHLESVPCVGCRSREYPHLEKPSGMYVVSLRGRNAVQICGDGGKKVDLQILASKLADQMDVTFNEYLLRCRISSFEVALFADGRAIVRGTEDKEQARDLYEKYFINA